VRWLGQHSCTFAMSTCYLTCTEGGADKFWSCEVSGKSTTVTFGAVGTDGRKADKTHKDAAAAEAFLEKMRAEKEKKGYKAVAKGRAKAKAKAEAKAEPKGRPEPKAKGRPEPPAEKRKADEDAGPALKKGKSVELLQKAKEKAERGESSTARPAGGRAVDGGVPGAGDYSVHEEYSVKLNQTHMEKGANNNKFYLIQVLEKGGEYYAWNRWGRVGEPGQNSLVWCCSPSGDASIAIKAFEKKFKDKTKNAWADRANFKFVDGFYSLVETEEGAGGEDAAPMGKLTEGQIGKGQGVLEKLQAELGKSKPVHSALETYSSEFFSLVPHNFGRARPPVINTTDMMEAKTELLKFYLRMGFEQVEEDTSMTPISGVMDIACPKSLQEAAGSLCSAAEIKASGKKGEEFCSKQAGNPQKKMDAHLYGAIMLYTSNAIYKQLNQCLRDQNRSKIKSYFKYLRLFFESMDTLPKQKKTLWRGLSVDLYDNPQYKLGQTVTWWGVSSCTADKTVATNFAKSCGGKCTVITLETETATDISEITFYSNEKESLLCPGTQLEVKKKERKGNVTEITLKEVGRAIG